MKTVTRLAVLMAAFALMVPAGAWAGSGRVRQAFDRVMVGGEDGPQVSVRFDEPAAEKAPAKSKDWGGFGGPMVQYFQLNVNPLEPMTRDRKIDNFDSGLILIGGVGGLINKDFRFGGFGFGFQDDVTGRVAGQHRRASMSFGGGGLLFEYNHAFNPMFGFDAGAMIGAGGIDLKATGLDLGPGKEWSENGTVFLAYPYLGIWGAPAKFFWVQLDAGYLYFDLDTGGSGYDNELNKDMVDGNLTGGFAASLKLNFGYNPNL
ncbi:MAG TPA: hypothetical protein VM658_08965 [bacterium]|nr:hypothetical protein [bacterium]